MAKRIWPRWFFPFHQVEKSRGKKPNKVWNISTSRYSNSSGKSCYRNTLNRSLPELHQHVQKKQRIRKPATLTVWISSVIFIGWHCSLAMKTKSFRINCASFITACRFTVCPLVNRRSPTRFTGRYLQQIKISSEEESHSKAAWATSNVLS